MSSNENFSPEHLLSCINLASEHEALELADQVEAAMYIWQRKACATYSKPSWDMVKDFTADGDKNITLATRAESLLLCLKQRYPGLSQTTLDTCKIQYNKVIHARYIIEILADFITNDDTKIYVVDHSFEG